MTQALDDKHDLDGLYDGPNILNDNYPKAYIEDDGSKHVFKNREEEEKSELIDFERFEFEMAPFGMPVPYRNRMKMIDGKGDKFNYTKDDCTLCGVRFKLPSGVLLPHLKDCIKDAYALD